MKQNKTKEPLKETTKTMSSDEQKVQGGSQPPQEKSNLGQQGSTSEDAESEKGHA